MTSGRKDCRARAVRCAPKNRDQALYCQGGHAEMTRAAIADAMGVNVSTLSNWLDPEHESEIPEERLLELLRLTDDHDAYLRYFAALQGFIVFDPNATRQKGRLARLASEFADLVKAIDAREDGTSVEDALRIEREGNELITVAAGEILDAKRAAGLAPKEPTS